jgi:hypothetical protein
MATQILAGQMLGFAAPTGGDTTPPPIIVGGGGGGGGGGSTTPPLTVRDDVGNVAINVTALTVLGSDVAQPSAGAARVTVRQVTAGPNVVLTGGAWVVRDLAPLSYQLTVTAGTGVVQGVAVRWPETTVTVPAVNALVYVDAAGAVRVRAAGIPETLPPANELLLQRAFVDVAVYGTRIYAVADARTYASPTPRAPLFLRDRVAAAKITSGAWSGATAVNDIGDINWYFANLGLYPFVEELPTQVLDHLNVQISKFYGASGTANASPTWNSVHGTTYGGTPNYLRWPYDVKSPRGTPVVARADSHDSYAATFLRLAVRYARVASGGLTWWDTNIAAIQDCAYYNLLTRQRFIGAGYLNETFQDATVYPFCQTMDNVEVYVGLKAALDLMTERGGSQATWAAGYSGAPGTILDGIRDMWSTSANAAGETDWFSVAWDNGASAKLTNQLQRFYPDLGVGVFGAVFGVAVGATTAANIARVTRSLALLDAKAPHWWTSRQYDLFPWGMLATAAVQLGLREVGEAWLAFVRRHHAQDSVGYLYIHELGWARTIERLLAGDVL